MGREERAALMRRIHEQETALGEARSALAKTTTDLVASQAALKEAQTAGARLAAVVAGGGGRREQDGGGDDGDGEGGEDDDPALRSLRDKLAAAERALEEASRAKLRALAQAGEAAKQAAGDRAELDALRARLAKATTLSS